jgi:hypothetical protein
MEQVYDHSTRVFHTGHLLEEGIYGRCRRSLPVPVQYDVK